MSSVFSRRVTPFALVMAATLALVGCFDVETVNPGSPPRRIARVEPDDHGWVAPGSNSLEITGSWYAYGDQYAQPARCTGYGKHPADVACRVPEDEQDCEQNGDCCHQDGQCSFVAWPDPLPWLDFANAGGRICTAGNAARVTSCKNGECQDQPQYDFSNMWGTGIGLDFGLPTGPNGQRPTERNVDGRTTWNAADHHTTGVSFDFSWQDSSAFDYPAVRVEFPVVLPPEGLTIYRDAILRTGEPVKASDDVPNTLPEGSTSEDHSSGSPFADAPKDWGNHDVSDVHQGHNEIPWSRIHAPPLTEYTFDAATLQILGIQFQVPTVKETRIPYAFCIENLAFTLD